MEALFRLQITPRSSRGPRGDRGGGNERGIFHWRWASVVVHLARCLGRVAGVCGLAGGGIQEVAGGWATNILFWGGGWKCRGAYSSVVAELRGAPGGAGGAGGGGRRRIKYWGEVARGVHGGSAATNKIFEGG